MVWFATTNHVLTCFKSHICTSRVSLDRGQARAQGVQIALSRKYIILHIGARRPRALIGRNHAALQKTLWINVDDQAQITL